jgi:hypothetical protein
VEGDFFFSEYDPQLQVYLEWDQRYPGRARVVVRAGDRAGNPEAYTVSVSVDIITSPAANVALAMGVDSMIHLVVRVRHLHNNGLATLESWS